MSDFFHHSCLELHEPFQTQVCLQTTEKFLPRFKIMVSPPCVAFFLLGFVLFPYDVSWVSLLLGSGFFPACFLFAIFALCFAFSLPLGFPGLHPLLQLVLNLKSCFLLQESIFFHIWFFFNALIVFSFPCCCAGCGLTPVILSKLQALTPGCWFPSGAYFPFVFVFLPKLQYKIY